LQNLESYKSSIHKLKKTQTNLNQKNIGWKNM